MADMASDLLLRLSLLTEGPFVSSESPSLESSSLSPPALGPNSREETMMGWLRRALVGDLDGLEVPLDFVGEESGVARCADADAERDADALVEDVGSSLMGSWPLTDLTMMRWGTLSVDEEEDEAPFWALPCFVVVMM